jgi:hypothetical protein
MRQILARVIPSSNRQFCRVRRHRGAQLRLPSYRLGLFRPGGTPLRVPYGRADLGRPQYDLALLGPQVMGAPALDVTLAAEQRNSPSDTTATLVSPRLFWAALGVAAIVLMGLIVRLLKKPIDR